MRVGVLTAARSALLFGATALAFFSGGYFDEARAWTGLGAWVLVVVALLVAPRALPRGRDAWLAVVGLALFGGWTLLSIAWAPIAGSAYHAGQLVFVYLGALLAAALLLQGRSAQRAVEPALAAGVLIVVGYGISERLLPGLLHFHESLNSLGRLEQPLTYWNAMGELAALGFVMSARVAGDATRARWLRATAAAASVPIALGLYLSLSRGALFAWIAGLLTLIVAVRRREQLRAALVTVVAGLLAVAGAAPFEGVTKLGGALGSRERQGAITLAVLVVIMLLAAGVQAWLAGRERGAELRLPRRAPLAAALLICAGLGLAIVAGAKEKSVGTSLSRAGANRLETLQSNRYDYWHVAMRAFDSQPLRGVGAGGWAVWWLRYRGVNEFAQDAHSLPIQTLAELGVVGLALLAAFLAGIGLTARRAYRLAPALAAGPIAGFVVWAAHAPLDWDWQMPAVTLVAMVLGGALLAQTAGLRPAPELTSMELDAEMRDRAGRAASVPAVTTARRPR